MRNFFTILLMWLGFSLAANAQTYIFSGDVDYGGNTALALAFGGDTTFTAALTFDTSQTTTDAAAYGAIQNYYEKAWYNIGSITYQLGEQSWTHNGSYNHSSSDHVYIYDGEITGYSDERITIYAQSDQLLSNGSVVDWAYFYIASEDYSNPTIFSGADASALLAFNSVSSSASGFMMIDGTRLSLSNVTLTATVPEPATWLMMIIGFGMVGAVSRKRRRSVMRPKAI